MVLGGVCVMRLECLFEGEGGLAFAFEVFGEILLRQEKKH